jgi:hypothetical protein
VDIDTFKIALRQHAAHRVVLAEKINQFGAKYTLQCAIETPDKRDPCIETVWIIEKGKTEPRLVTAYPSDLHKK